MNQSDAVASPLGQMLAQQLPGMPARDIAFYVSFMTADEPYALGDDSLPRAGVPQGELNRHAIGAAAGFTRAWSAISGFMCRASMTPPLPPA